MKSSSILNLILFSLIFVSCGYKKEAKEVTQNFFVAVKNEDMKMMNELYPGMENLRYYMKSDSILIKEVVKLDDHKYSISLTNKFTNGLGKSTDTEIVIYTEPKNPNKPGDGYVVYDSKGLCDLSSDDVYKFGRRKGYISGSDLTDQQEAVMYNEASDAFKKVAEKFYKYLVDNVRVVNWNWETLGYIDSASGRGVVKNNTKYSIPKVRYLITYLNPDGTEATQDSGDVILFGSIRPYGMESFSFYTSYVGRATKARIKLEFDDNFIYKTIGKGEYE